MIRAWANKLRAWLQHRYLPWHLALLAMVLCAPSLRLGWIGDDDFHRAVLTRPEIPTIPHSPAEMFVFIEGNEAVNRQNVAFGLLPWWSHEQLRLAFFRPLTGLTHWIDYKIWPQLPALMHLHSLIWFGAAVAAATCFYRRMFPGAWVAGLAALLFAVDDAHGLPVVWLANRNALIGVFFGLLTLITYDKWRRDRWWPGAVLAPLTLLLGLLAKESTVATGAYLLAYALFLDRDTWARRLGALVPCALTGVIWWVAYEAFGYGASGSGWYIDPGADLVQFAQLVAVRAPILLAWQWLVPSDLEWAMSPPAAHLLWLATFGFLLILAVALVPLWRRDSLARFWTTGMVLSVVPACTAFPSGRLLFFVGIGGMGLLAQFVAAALEKQNQLSPRMWRSAFGGVTRALCIVLIVIHLGIAPVALAQTAGNHNRWGRTAAQAAASLPSGPAALLQTVVIVNTPAYAVFAYCVLKRVLSDQPYLSRSLVLGSGDGPVEIRRPDEHTLLVRVGDGFLASPENHRSGRETERLLFDQRRQLPALDRLYRDNSPTTIGQRIKFVGVTAEITAITEDGRPAEVAFSFALKLESRLFRWMQWEDEGYVPFVLPAVGETVTLPTATIPFAR